jgi:hypothetical protein
MGLGRPEAALVARLRLRKDGLILLIWALRIVLLPHDSTR